MSTAARFLLSTMRYWAKIPLLLCAAATASCGPSREEAAVERILNRKPPGSVRLVNFTQSPVEMWVDGARSSGNIAPGQASPFVAMAAGKHEVKAMAGSASVAVATVSLGGRNVVSAMLAPHGAQSELSIVTGEPRQMEDGAIKVAGVFVGVDPADKVEIQANGKTVGTTFPPLQATLLPGLVAGKTTFDIKVGGKTARLPVDLESNSDYTLVAYPQGSGISAALLRNSGEKPAMAGAAAGG